MTKPRRVLTMLTAVAAALVVLTAIAPVVPLALVWAAVCLFGQ